MADDAFGDSDHDTVKFVIILESVIDRTQELTDNARFIWLKANFDLMDSYLSSIDWHTVLLNNPDALQFWSTIYGTVEMAVPKQTTTAYHSSKKCINKRYPRAIRIQKASCQEMIHVETSLI